ncbi:hypothetical protein D3C85_1829630 [compost metagenome]
MSVVLYGTVLLAERVRLESEQPGYIGMLYPFIFSVGDEPHEVLPLGKSAYQLTPLLPPGM